MNGYEAEMLGSLRVPPHSVEAEMSVLGGLMLCNEALEDVNEILNADDFYRGGHKKIYESIIEMGAKNQPFDVVTLSQYLDDRRELESVGGISYLGMLANNTPTAANIMAYSEIVSSKALERNWITASLEASNIVWGNGDTGEKIDKAQAVMSGVVEDKHPGQLKNAVTLFADLTDRIDRNMINCGALQGLSSGLSDLDELTLGLCDEDLIIVAGRPSMGKTSLALKFVDTVLKENKSVFFASAEMPGDQLAARLAAMNAKIDLMAIRRGDLTDADCSKLTNEIGRMSQTKLYVDDMAAPSVNQIRARARAVRRQHGLDLIVVDYIGLMSGDGRDGNERIQAISRGLKGLAKELKVPVVALSQLNRSLEQRQNKRPIMSDLRESGAIEQDADVIIFVYRDEVYNSSTLNPGAAEIIIGKQRNGPLGTIHAAWLAKYTVFENYCGQWREEIPTKPGFNYKKGNADRWNV